MRGFGNGKSSSSSVLASCQSSRSKRFKSIDSRSWEGNYPENFTYLPVELITEVFEWLPIKSIARFRCVSKSCSALFKTPTFIENHRRKQGAKGIMLLLRHIPPLSDLDVLSFHDLDSPEREVRPSMPIWSILTNLIGRETTKEFNLLGPKNGIICIFFARRFILCNPALHEFKLLPAIPWAASPHGCTYKKCIIATGFGVSASEDFKVIIIHSYMHRFHGILRRDVVVAHLYDSRTNSWRQFDDAPALPITCLPDDEVYLNGASHWAGVTFADERKCILSFDMTSEVFRQLELPDCLQGQLELGDCLPGFNAYYPHLIVLNNCLGVFQYKECSSKSVEIWVMKEYGLKESWTKLFVISPQPFATSFLPWKNDIMFLLQQPGCIERTTSRTGDSTYSDSSFIDQLTSINLHTSEMKKCQVFGAETTIQGLIYEESLVSLN